MDRKQILDTAEKMVNGDRQDDYGTPENNFARIADFWCDYLGEERLKESITPVDVAAMLALLKLARIASGHGKSDNWIDLAGYAACGGELEEATRGDGNDEAVDWNNISKSFEESAKQVSESVTAFAKKLKKKGDA